MSIVGTQSVSLSDLMKLGPQALGAMAQGQTQSIAPSYMVIAALKALTDQQRGTGAQVPQGTVKDQVLAQAAPPPAQAGIGAMQQPPMGQGMPPPVRQFAGGGPVGTAAVNAKIADFFRERFGPGWDQFKEETRRGLAGRRRTEDEDNYSNEHYGRELPKGTEATKPGGAPVERAEGGRGKVNPPTVAEMSKAESEIIAPPAARGIGSTGVNPTAKYGKLGAYGKMGELAKPDQHKLDIPKNQQLLDAVAKFSKPDEARMKELRGAEENAGLAAFARGMMNTKNGTGFGAVFGPAAADYVDTKEAKAEKRRAYEDQREALATQLGIQVGKEAKDDYLANSKWGAERADAANKQAIDILRSNNEATRFGNADTIEREKMAQQERLEMARMAIMSEANKIAAEVRRDGVDARKFERLLALQQGASKVAQDAADAWVKANPAAMAGGPDIDRRVEDIKRREYQRLFPKELEALMKEGLGIGGAAQPTQADPNKVVRGRL